MIGFKKKVSDINLIRYKRTLVFLGTPVFTPHLLEYYFESL